MSLEPGPVPRKDNFVFESDEAGLSAVQILRLQETWPFFPPTLL